MVPDAGLTDGVAAAAYIGDEPYDSSADFIHSSQDVSVVPDLAVFFAYLLFPDIRQDPMEHYPSPRQVHHRFPRRGFVLVGGGGSWSEKTVGFFSC